MDKDIEYYINVQLPNNGPPGSGFQKSRAIGYCSIDANRRPHYNSIRNLKYFCSTDVGERQILDLSKGYEDYIRKPDNLVDEEKLNIVLGWLLHNKEYFMSQVLNQEESKYTFVTVRNALTKLMQTGHPPHTPNYDPWRICATKYKNLIFLCPFNNDKRIERNLNGRADSLRPMEYWALKYKHYFLSETPGRKPNPEQSVNENEEFLMVYRNRFNDKHDVLFAAEMCGIKSEKSLDETVPSELVDHLQNKNFVELRSVPSNFMKQRSKNQRMFKWWARNVLVGVEEIVCGLRNRYGFVNEIKTYRFSDIEKMLTQDCSKICNNLSAYLTSIEEKLKDTPDLVTWKFEWTPGSPTIHAQILHDSKKFKILDDSFVEKCSKLMGC